MGQATTSCASVSDVYHLQKVKLGEGSFGIVWRGVHKKSGEVVAVKQLRKASMPARGVKREDVERELKMLGAMSHENIIRFCGDFEDRDCIYIALEYCDGGDFADKVLERGDRVSEAEAAYWVHQMVAAIGFLHGHYVCHRDIKPENFLVAQGDRLKLADMGLAVTCTPGKLLADKCGTPAFMAPEQHELPKRSAGYGLPVDMWAAGVCMFMLMAAGRHPFLSARGGLDERRLLSGNLDFRQPGLWALVGLGGGQRVSEDARQICQQMVCADPRRRLTARDAGALPWFGLRHTHRTDECEPADDAVGRITCAADTSSPEQPRPPAPGRKWLRRRTKDSAADAAAGGAAAMAGAAEPPPPPPVWEFSVRDGYQPYEAECLEALEEQYQAFLSGRGPPVGAVVSLGREIAVDFRRMQQEVKGSTGRSRRVRRRRVAGGGA